MGLTYGPYPGKVLDWHDGDTCHVDLDLGFGFALLAFNPISNRPWISCRIFGINAPELKTGEPGKAATDHALSLCPPGTIVAVLSHGWDKYGGRFDATITLPDGRDFATEMLQAGHAVPMKV
jgi:endonuclease YncB( thermonuclease family)